MTIRTTVLALGAVAALCAAATAQDAVVPDDFNKVSRAVSNATDVDGDGTIEIFVRSGTYTERVQIKRDNIQLIGEGAGSTEIRFNGSKATIEVRRADDFEIAGFTISGGSGEGIKLNRANNGWIHDNVIENNDEGIRASRSSGNTIENNLIIDNSSEGIKLSGSHNNVIANNTCDDNGSHGIDVDESNNTLIESNICTRNMDNGIRVRDAANTDILNNDSSDNVESGLRMRDTTGSMVSGNALNDNGDWGLRLRDGQNDDFDASAGGVQGPMGTNSASGNTLGALELDD